MSDQPERAVSQKAVPPVTNSRILIIMFAVGILGSLFGSFYFSPRAGIGFFFGTAVAFANYYWLRHSLSQIFSAASEGTKPRFSLLKFFGRYFALGVLIAIVYVTKAVPIESFIFGAAGFAFAVMIEGFIRIFTTIFTTKEI